MVTTNLRMPLYEYRHDRDHGAECQESFEVLQSINDAPLDHCPVCGFPCHRVLSSFATIRNEQAMFRPKNLERLGFTQYKRVGHGQYEKTCGKGPPLIRGDRP